MDPLLEPLLELVLCDLRRIRFAATAAAHIVTTTAQTPTARYIWLFPKRHTSLFAVFSWDEYALDLLVE